MSLKTVHHFRVPLGGALVILHLSTLDHFCRGMAASPTTTPDAVTCDYFSRHRARWEPKKRGTN